jgi:putative FmdB family regulatory protein
MPIYGYKCAECGSSTDINKKIADRHSTETDICSTCGSQGKLQLEVSAPLVGYSISVNGGYGSKVPDGFKDVLRNIDRKAGVKKQNSTSSFL